MGRLTSPHQISLSEGLCLTMYLSCTWRKSCYAYARERKPIEGKITARIINKSQENTHLRGAASELSCVHGEGTVVDEGALLVIELVLGQFFVAQVAVYGTLEVDAKAINALDALRLGGLVPLEQAAEHALTRTRTSSHGRARRDLDLRDGKNAHLEQGNATTLWERECGTTCLPTTHTVLIVSRRGRGCGSMAFVDAPDTCCAPLPSTEHWRFRMIRGNYFSSDS